MEKEPNIFEDPIFEQAYKHVACEVGVEDSLLARSLFAEAAMYANLNYYKPTIPSNPLHAIFMAKAKGYMLRKMYPASAVEFCKREDLEVAYQRTRLSPIYQQHTP